MEDKTISWFGNTSEHPEYQYANTIKVIEEDADMLTLRYNANEIALCESVDSDDSADFEIKQPESVYISASSIRCVPEEYKIDIKKMDNSKKLDRICLYVTEDTQDWKKYCYDDDLIDRFDMTEKFTEIELAGNFETYDDMVRIINKISDKFAYDPDTVSIIIHLDSKIADDRGDAMTLSEGLFTGYIQPGISDKIKGEVNYHYMMLDLEDPETIKEFDERYTKHSALDEDGGFFDANNY